MSSAAVAVVIQHAGQRKAIQCAAGTSLEELRAVLGTAFAVDAAAVVGVVSPRGVASPLSLVSKAPTHFARGREFSVLLATPPAADADADEATVERAPVAKISVERAPVDEVAAIDAADAVFRAEFGDNAFHLRELGLREILAIFCSEAHDQLSRTAYARCASLCVESARKRGLLPAGSSRDAARASAVFARIWSTFERYAAATTAQRTHEPCIDVSVLLAALSVVVDGGREIKVSETFALFDSNGDGVVSFEEAVRYFFAILAVSRERDPRAFRAQLGASNEEVTLSALAIATAKNCFAHADTDADGLLTFAEFEAWSTAQSQPAKNTLPPALDAARDLVGLGDCPARTLSDALCDAADSNGQVSERAFVTCVSRFSTRGASSRVSDRRAILARLFELFDSGNGADALMLAAGVTTLCGGTRDEKVSAVLGEDDRSCVSRAQLRSYFSAIFRVLEDGGDDTSFALAAATADQCFSDLGASGDITLGAFREWYAVSEEQEEQEEEEEEEDDDDLSRLSGAALVRRATLLETYSLEEVATLFAAVDTERVDRSAFVAIMSALRDDERRCAAAAHFGVDGSTARQIVDELYSALDSPGAGLNKAELLCGLSTLTRGTREKNTLSALELLGEDASGLTYDAAHAYLRAVFRFIIALEPCRAGGTWLSADDLARQVAAKAFSAIGVPTSGRLPIRAFAVWHQENVEAYEDEPTGSRAAAKKPRDAGDAGDVPQAPKLKAIAEIVRLGDLDVRTAMAAFLGAADESGHLDRRAFVRCLAPEDSGAVDAASALFDCVRERTSVFCATDVRAKFVRLKQQGGRGGKK